ncbi:junction-mediating and -regulatory protein-like [Corticium candelabrum]|uniref:junction-mediating and -regulatory protein-like n=1 Tax=Corticium candelabrum TaxID=121492 RepID=UPI002E256ED7|nr:junction-mediating and -regulatory protein-like [Corticium candelabrum]
MASDMEDPLAPVAFESDEEWLAVNFQEAACSDSSLRFKVRKRENSNCQLVISCSDVDGEEKNSWEVTWSLEKLAEKHSELLAIFPSLRQELPVMPKRPSGIWSYLYSFKIPDEFYSEVEAYLLAVTSFCGKEMILETFFGVETSTLDSFLVSLADFDKGKVTYAVQDAKITLEETGQMRQDVTSAEELVVVYEHEDAALIELDRQELKLAELEEQPFADLRDLEQQERHFHRMNSIDGSLSNQEQLQSVGKERESHEEYLRAQNNLLDLHEEKYESMVYRTTHCIEQMLKDKDRFGPSWEEHGRDRMKRMEEKMVIMTVELLKVRSKKLRLEKDRKLMEIATVEESRDLDEIVKIKEKEFYELHIKWLDVMLLLLEEQEKKVKLEIGNEADGSRVKKLRSKEGKLASKRSHLRNQKRVCVAAVKKNSYGWIYMEKSASAKQAAEKKQDAERVNAEKLKQQKIEERRRTLDRIHTFKERYPMPEVKKPPRYLPPSRLKQKQERKKTPASSSSIMASSMASIRASAAKNKSRPSSRNEMGKKPAHNGPPAVPPPPAAVEAKLAALSDIDLSALAPASPPPASPTLPVTHAPPVAPPLPPAAPPALPTITETKPAVPHVAATTQSKVAAAVKKETRVAPGVFDIASILAARKSLKVTGFSGALAGGVNEMKVLLRAGVKEDTNGSGSGSLSVKATISDTNAEALSAALDRMKPFTSGDTSAESSSSSDDDD